MKKKVYKKYINDLMKSSATHDDWYDWAYHGFLWEDSPRKKFIRGKRMKRILFSYNGKMYKDLSINEIFNNKWIWAYRDRPVFKPNKRYGLEFRSIEGDGNMIYVQRQHNGAYR